MISSNSKDMQYFQQSQDTSRQQLQGVHLNPSYMSHNMTGMALLHLPALSLASQRGP